jgi:hypothetical protein
VFGDWFSCRVSDCSLVWLPEKTFFFRYKYSEILPCLFISLLPRRLEWQDVQFSFGSNSIMMCMVFFRIQVLDLCSFESRELGVFLARLNRGTAQVVFSFIFRAYTSCTIEYSSVVLPLGTVCSTVFVRGGCLWSLCYESGTRFVPLRSLLYIYQNLNLIPNWWRTNRSHTNSVSHVFHDWLCTHILIILFWWRHSVLT